MKNRLILTAVVLAFIVGIASPAVTEATGFQQGQLDTSGIPLADRSPKSLFWEDTLTLELE